MSNWEPSNAAMYIRLDWDYTNQSLSPGTTLKLILTLTVSPDIINIHDFNFDTSITATG